MTTVEFLWTEARNQHGEFRDRRTPSAGIAAVLVALWEHGSSYGSEIAVQAGHAQPNVAFWLAKLRRFGFVDVIEEAAGYGHQGGGRPAVFWGLTRAGRELAGLLVADEGRVAA